MHTPRLTAVLITPTNFDLLRKSVAHLKQQTARGEIEIVFVAPSKSTFAVPDSQWSELCDEFCGVRLVEIGRIRCAGAALASGFAAASAPIVAYVEEHGYPEPDWAEQVLRAHEQTDAAAVGNRLINANPRTLASWITMLKSFPYAATVETSGPTSGLPWHHSSYKRELILPLRDKWPLVFECEGLLHQWLTAQGYKLYQSREAVVHHLNVSRIWAVFPNEFCAGQVWGSHQAEFYRWSFGRRLFQLMIAPMRAGVRWWRIVQPAAGARELRGHVFSMALPLALAVLFHALGEGWGAAAGDRGATEHRAQTELNRRPYLVESDRPLMD